LQGQRLNAIIPGGVSFVYLKCRILWQKSPRWHPFSFLIEPISEVKVCGNSLSFSERTFIRMMTRIMQIVIANPLPTASKEGKFKIILYNAGLG